MLENGDKLVKELRKERYVDKSRKVSDIIKRRNMPRMDLKENTPSLAAPVEVTPQMIAAAQREIDIAKERGMPAAQIYKHDFLPTSSIFEGKLPKKATKSHIVTELEKLSNINEADTRKPERALSLIMDFMSTTRSKTIPPDCTTFGDLIHYSLNVARQYNTDILHVVRDSYIEATIKAAERLRRENGVDPIVYSANDITPDLQLPDLDKFWPHSQNKVQYQNLVGPLVQTEELVDLDVLASGYITDDETFPAILYKSGRSAINSNHDEMQSLGSVIEEADDRLLHHAVFEVKQGAKCILVLSNDADTVVKLLYGVGKWKQMGLEES